MLQLNNRPKKNSLTLCGFPKFQYYSDLLSKSSIPEEETCSLFFGSDLRNSLAAMALREFAPLPNDLKCF
jgi:hypothetical protein